MSLLFLTGSVLITQRKVLQWSHQQLGNIGWQSQVGLVSSSPHTNYSHEVSFNAFFSSSCHHDFENQWANTFIFLLIYLSLFCGCNRHKNNFSWASFMLSLGATHWRWWQWQGLLSQGKASALKEAVVQPSILPRKRIVAPLAAGCHKVAPPALDLLHPMSTQNNRLMSF